MSGWLALVGGAEWTAGCSFDETLLQHSGSPEVVVLPTAAAFEQPERAVETAKRWFAPLGATVTSCPILSRADAENPAFVAQLMDAKFVYVAGGSAMHLRSTLKDTAAFEALRRTWRNGAVLAASSAGAMALGDPMLDPRGGAFTIGLGLLPGLAVLPHAHSWSDERVRRTLRLAGANVTLALVDECTALVRSPAGLWTVEGAGGVRVHAKGIDSPDLRLLNDVDI